MLFDDDAYPIWDNIAIWDNAWFMRVVSQTATFGRPLRLSNSHQLLFDSLVFLPGIGLVIACSSHDILLLHSLEDEITSVFAGINREIAKYSFRTKSSFFQPQQLTRLNDGRLVMTVHKKDGLCFISPAGETSFKPTATRLGERAISIAETPKGDILLITEDCKTLRVLSSDKSQRSIAPGNYMGNPIITPSTKLLPLRHDRNLVCSPEGIFLLNGLSFFEPVLPAKVLGFVPTGALELSPTIFLISDHTQTQIVEISGIDSGNIIQIPLTDALGVNQNSVSILSSMTGPFCFDESSGAIWSIVTATTSSYLVTFYLEDVERAISSIAAKSSSDSSSSSATNVNNLLPPKFKIVPLTAACGADSGNLFSGPSSLSVTPNGNILTYTKYGISWYDSAVNSFKPLAGATHELGCEDGFRLDARCNGISSICFRPSSLFISMKDVAASGIPKLEASDNFLLLDTLSSESRLETLPSGYSVDLVTDEDGRISFRPIESIQNFISRLLGSDYSLLFTDCENHRIRELRVDGTVSTFSGSQRGTKDGPKMKATFTRPFLMTMGKYGDLFVTSANDMSIRRISCRGIVSTLHSSFAQNIPHVSLPSYSALTCCMETGDLYLSYENQVFRAECLPEYKRWIANDFFSGNNAAAASAPAFSIKKHLSSRFSGIKDGPIANALYQGPITGLRVNTSDWTTELSFLDYKSSSIRFVSNDVVNTIFAEVKDSHFRRLGVSGVGNPVSVASLSKRVLLVSDARESIYLVTDMALPTSKVVKGFPLPKRDSRPSQEYDYALTMGGTTWYINSNILKVRAPGLLEEANIRMIEEKTWFQDLPMEKLWRAIHIDEMWRERHPAHSLTGSNLTELFRKLSKFYRGALLLRNSCFTKSIEEQIQDVFRAVPTKMAEYITLNGEDDEMGFGTDFIESHCSISILEEINGIMEDDGRGMSTGSEHELEQNSGMKLLRLLLPFVIDYYVGESSCFDRTNVIQALPKPEIYNLVLQQVINNRRQLPALQIYPYHEDWVQQFRSLLTSRPKEYGYGKSEMDRSEFTLVAPDMIVEGRETIWHVHKWILAVKCPFFQTLFHSNFSDSSTTIWKVPTSETDPGYMEDCVIGAFLDYIYTEDPEKINQLEHSKQLQLLDTIPFYFVDEARMHQSVIGNPITIN